MCFRRGSAVIFLLALLAVTLWGEPACSQLRVAWSAVYEGGGPMGDQSAAIALDSGGHVLVAGHSWNSRSGWDYVTVKYSPAGRQLWAELYDGPASLQDFPALAIDAADNVLITGTKVIVYAGHGGGTCQGADEATYLRQMLEWTTAANRQRFQIHCFGLSIPGQTQEDFLKKLAEANGGTYTRIDN